MNSSSQTIVNNIRQDNCVEEVTFVVDDLEIKENRRLLAASCPYFERLLFGNTNEANQKRIELHSTCKEAFQKVIEFINNDECYLYSMDERTIIALIRLAHEYQFVKLLSYLKTKINVSSYSASFCTELFDFAYLVNHEHWKIACLINLEKYFIFKVNIDWFATFSRTLVDQLTARDTFAINEMDVFRCLLKWKDVNQNDSHEGLFANLRLNLISISDFKQFVRPVNVISSNEYIDAITEDRWRKRYTQNKDTERIINFNRLGVTKLTMSDIQMLQTQNEMRDHQNKILKTQIDSLKKINNLIKQDKQDVEIKLKKANQRNLELYNVFKNFKEACDQIPPP